MKKKKNIYIILFILLFSVENLFSQVSFQNLVDFAINNNVEIKNAKTDYDCSIISADTLNGFYSPQINLTAAASVDKNYTWKNNPDSFSSTMSIIQNIPGGFRLSTSGEYEFTTWEENLNSSFETIRKIQQMPEISFSIENSMVPYWLQGILIDPEILTIKQQKEFCYNQLLIKTKEVLENLLQNYCMAIIEQKNIEIYENSILLVDEQIKAFEELYEKGIANQSKITELSNDKWKYQQSLISTISDYEECIQSLKILCGCDFDKNFLGKTVETVDEVVNKIISHLDYVVDPYEKNLILQIEMLENERIYDKENKAPYINFSISPVWDFEPTEESKWKDTWKKKNDFSAWNIYVGIDFSGMLQSFIKKDSEQLSHQFQKSKELYDIYLNQKKIKKEQYEYLFDMYNNQLMMITKILERNEEELSDLKIQKELGIVSNLDYYTFEINIENTRLTKDCIESYIWLYDILRDIN